MNTQSCIDVIKTSVENGIHPPPPDPDLYKPTSVIALFLFEKEPRLLFIQKADVPGYPWANQMAFPGGHKDKTDATSRDTALRELSEELQIESENVEIIGSLGHFQTLNSRDIEAWVGIWNQKDDIHPDTDEISRVIPIPLKHLMEQHQERGLSGRPADIMTLQYPYKDVLIWGVTAKIVHHLLEILPTAP